MSKRVFVTGIGVISALGANVEENHAALKNSKSGIGKAKVLDSIYSETMPFGEIPFTTDELKERAGVAKEKGISRTETMAILAFQEAIQSANLSSEDLSSFRLSFISASTVGGMTHAHELINDSLENTQPTEFLSAYPLGEHTNNLIERYHLKGISGTINTACSASANAIMTGAKLIKSGRCDRAIVGGADALSKFTVNGFNALQILSSAPSMPFDEERTGLNLGEGAAYLILESEEVVGNKKIYGELVGYGNANDAFHPSSMSEEAIGVKGAISQALNSAQLKAESINYINTHGTGTHNNDRIEQKGIVELFKQVPPFHSTKSYTGHTLGAAGAIEAVIGLLAMQNSEIYASLNCNNPIKEFGIEPIKEYQDQVEINYFLSNSFGFGGNCSSLIFAKV
jgi:3-oxoacyl-(acyl-carrier-protein) synthase